LKAAVWIAEVNNRVLKCLGRAHDSKLRRIALCVKYIITLMRTSAHTRLLVPLCSGTLLRGDGRECRSALFYLVTTAVWAGGLFRVMLCDAQNLRECLLAGVAKEFVVGHSDLPRSLNGYSWILDPWLEQVQHGSVSTRRRRCLLFRRKVRR
jgi:hypothetical protein